MVRAEPVVAGRRELGVTQEQAGGIPTLEGPEKKLVDSRGNAASPTPERLLQLSQSSVLN